MISRSRKTLFVHIPKTGGQSIESVFLKDAGLAWRDRGQLGLGRNPDKENGPTRLAHLYASEYVALGHVTQAEFDAFTRFAIVRHPYDRMISEYRYRAASWKRKGDPAVGFDDFIRWTPEDEKLDIARHLVPQVTYVQDSEGRSLVPHIVHLEQMAVEMAGLWQTMLGTIPDVPHKNASKPKFGPGRQDLTVPQKRFLQDRYAEDFQCFGYDP
ncbi:sulfotransferase family 2 domain-containing protein [Phaeobacter marinintestinus]|uniref:sulfotransferase family 2 domain-containing protein n=1 Tax=Falsiphaeobacter marinintestinus TaxID=1492905 RepID=UPI0011B55C69|nr:sulfotransferase family 2 domain-containing protein [Phaeobacter marinintestinus]